MTREIRKRLLRDIPQLGITGAFEDEIVYKAIGIDLDNDGFKDSLIKLKYKKGLSLLGGKQWSEIESLPYASTLKKTLSENNDEIKGITKEFKIGKSKFTAKLSFEFSNDKTIKESFIQNNNFAVTALVVELKGEENNQDVFSDADNKTLKKKIKEFKEEYVTKLTHLTTYLNQNTNGKNIINSIVK